MSNLFKGILAFIGISLLMRACNSLPHVSNNPVFTVAKTAIDKAVALGLEISKDYFKSQIIEAVAGENSDNTKGVVINNTTTNNLSSFYPDEFANRHGISFDQSQDSINQQVAQVDNKILQDIAYCTEFGYKSQASDNTPLMYQKRYECMVNKGYNENDQVYMSVKYKTSWSYKVSHS